MLTVPCALQQVYSSLLKMVGRVEDYVLQGEEPPEPASHTHSHAHGGETGGGDGHAETEAGGHEREGGDAGEHTFLAILQ